MNKTEFKNGILSGLPVCLGYFAVSFALGIAAKNINMSAWLSGVMSAGMLASAGEFAALRLLEANAGIAEIILTCLIVNMRYFLMSCSLTQKLSENVRPIHRVLLPYCITDEIFALSSAVKGKLNPFYTYGIAFISTLGWTSGTMLGVAAGNILPMRVVNALNVALYGMFLAIIIPPAKKERFIAGLVALSMAASLLFSVTPVLKNISSGFSIIILTVLIAGGAAVIRPIKEERDELSA